jgi:hypothetical protein
MATRDDVNARGRTRGHGLVFDHDSKLRSERFHTQLHDLALHYG